MFEPGSIISYNEMCAQEDANLQRGMNYRLSRDYSVILMSQRPNAPYNDQIEEGGRILIYEGHDIPKKDGVINPKKHDQREMFPSGKLTQNGLFYQAAMDYMNGQEESELVRVYEKIRSGIWVYNGVFKLIDAWTERSDNRTVFKFKLEISDEDETYHSTSNELPHNRMIPSSVKREVWRRDKGKCVICGSTKNLHFDHIIPFSKGGTSRSADNIQILCAKHNLEKRNKIK